MRKSNRILLVLLTALALCACTNHDSDFFPGADAKNGSSESGGGEEVKDVNAVLVVAPYDKAATEMVEWGDDLADLFGVKVAVGFTGIKADDTAAADFDTAAEASAALIALDPKPTKVVVFKLVAYGEGATATGIEEELVAALSAFDASVAIERVNGFGYGDFLTAYLKARLAELSDVADPKCCPARDEWFDEADELDEFDELDELDEIMVGDGSLFDMNLSQSVLIVPVKENPEAINLDAAARAALGVKNVTFVENTYQDIFAVMFNASLPLVLDKDRRLIDNPNWANLFKGGRQIVVPYLSTPADLLFCLNNIKATRLDLGYTVIFNKTIIDDDTSLSIIKAAVEGAE